jgi:hypothetical protein
MHAISVQTTKRSDQPEGSRTHPAMVPPEMAFCAATGRTLSIDRTATEKKILAIWLPHLLAKESARKGKHAGGDSDTAASRLQMRCWVN